MIPAHALRAQGSRQRTLNYFAIAVAAARQQATIAAPAPTVERLTVTADAMPHHYIARAVVLDLQPDALVAVLGTVLNEIRRTYPVAQKTGWRAASDGLTVYFYAWAPTVKTAPVMLIQHSEHTEDAQSSNEGGRR